MALITKIREKSGWAIGFIAISLILFIVGSDFVSGSGSIFSSGDQSVGEISGNTIMAQDFNQELEKQRADFQSQYGTSPNESQMAQIREQAWNSFLDKYGYQKEYDALGIKVSDEEMVDMVQGDHVHPQIMQMFSNPQTRQFDKTQVIQFLKNFNTLQPQQKQAWKTLENQLKEIRLKEKYLGLIQLSTYTTTDEAKREYQAQTAKADLRYLFVPLYSVVDSTVKVSDGDLESYLSKHKDQYKGSNTRSMQYAVFPVVPTKADSADFYTKIKTYARELAATPNDSAYARLNSDEPQASVYMSINQMSDQLKEAVKTFNPGGIYGPYRDGSAYSIYKFGGTKKDSLYTVRASHILIGQRGMSDSAKASARIKAEGILARLKGGADFAAVAATESSDGSARQGGDLGYFKNNKTMVKPFEAAVFAFNGTGLLPNVVESEFGFHIIKVTEAKNNTLYKVAEIKKILEPSQATRDEAFRRADQFVSESGNADEFKANAKKSNIAVLTALRIAEGSSNINNLNDAREAVRWAFNDDTNTGSVSSAFEVDDQYIVCLLTGKTNKDKVTVDDFRDELTARVRAQLKGEQILAKISGANGTLEQIAQKYGAGALVETANGVSLNGGSLTSAGADPVAIGKGLGLKPGSKSKAFIGENGVFIVECLNKTAAPEIKDYTTYKNNARMMTLQRAGYSANEAIKENAKVVDNRAKFY